MLELRFYFLFSLLVLCTWDAAIKQGLIRAGLDPTGLLFKDGSGESENNLVPATFINALLKKILNEEGDLEVIKQALPIAAETGSLANLSGGHR